jgi:hypothetical protein
VDLQYIDVCAQPLDTGIDGVEDMLAGETNTVDDHWAIVHSRGHELLLLRHSRELFRVKDAAIAFGENDDSFTANVVVLQGLANDTLGVAEGVEISLGHYSALEVVCSWSFEAYCVPGIDAIVESMLDDGQSFFFRKRPGHLVGLAILHATENDLRDLET